MPLEPNKGKIKVAAFAKRYVENGMNGAKTVKEVFKTRDDKVATVQASRMLVKANVRDAILAEMQNKRFNMAFVLDKHKRNIKQKKNYSASNAAVDMFYKLVGAYAPEERHNLNLNIPLDPKEFDKALNDLKSQVDTLSGMDNG